MQRTVTILVALPGSVRVGPLDTYNIYMGLVEGVFDDFHTDAAQDSEAFTAESVSADPGGVDNRGR